VAERQFRKVQGYREIPARLTALANIVSKKGVAGRCEGCVTYDRRVSLTFNGVPGNLPCATSLLIVSAFCIRSMVAILSSVLRLHSVSFTANN
jgi:hypothetical protein